MFVLIIIFFDLKDNFNYIHFIFKRYYTIKRAPVAQLDRALGYGPGGSGFKS